MLNKEKDLKMFWSIGEVAEMLGVNESTLRFCETKFPTIKPRKAGRGIRQYTKADIEELKKIIHLVKERGLTLQGAHEALRNGKSNEIELKVEVIERLKAVKAELQAISKEFNSLT